eukprot:Rmarinus@m.1642
MIRLQPQYIRDNALKSKERASTPPSKAPPFRRGWSGVLRPSSQSSSTISRPHTSHDLRPLSRDSTGLSTGIKTSTRRRGLGSISVYKSPAFCGDRELRQEVQADHTRATHDMTQSFPGSGGANKLALAGDGVPSNSYKNLLEVMASYTEDGVGTTTPSASATSISSATPFLTPVQQLKPLQQQQHHQHLDSSATQPPSRHISTHEDTSTLPSHPQLVQSSPPREAEGSYTREISLDHSLCRTRARIAGGWGTGSLEETEELYDIMYARVKVEAGLGNDLPSFQGNYQSLSLYLEQKLSEISTILQVHGDREKATMMAWCLLSVIAEHSGQIQKQYRTLLALLFPAIFSVDTVGPVEGGRDFHVVPHFIIAEVESIARWQMKEKDFQKEKLESRLATLEVLASSTKERTQELLADNSKMTSVVSQHELEISEYVVRMRRLQEQIDELNVELYKERKQRQEDIVQNKEQRKKLMEEIAHMKQQTEATKAINESVMGSMAKTNEIIRRAECQRDFFRSLLPNKSPRPDWSSHFVDAGRRTARAVKFAMGDSTVERVDGLYRTIEILQGSLIDREKRMESVREINGKRAAGIVTREDQNFRDDDDDEGGGGGVLSDVLLSTTPNPQAAASAPPAPGASGSTAFPRSFRSKAKDAKKNRKEKDYKPLPMHHEFKYTTQDHLAKGCGDSVPRFLRWEGYVRHIPMSRSETCRLVRELWAEKKRVEQYTRQNISVEDFFYDLYMDLYGVPSVVAEMGYNLIYNLGLHDDPMMQAWQMVLKRELPEQILVEWDQMLANVYAAFVDRDVYVNAGKITSRLPTQDVLKIMEKMFELKTPEQHEEAMESLKRNDSDELPPFCNYQELFTPIADSTEALGRAKKRRRKGGTMAKVQRSPATSSKGKRSGKLSSKLDLLESSPPDTPNQNSPSVDEDRIPSDVGMMSPLSGSNMPLKSSLGSKSKAPTVDHAFVRTLKGHFLNDVLMFQRKLRDRLLEASEGRKDKEPVSLHDVRQIIKSVDPDVSPYDCEKYVRKGVGYQTDTPAYWVVIDGNTTEEQAKAQLHQQLSDPYADNKKVDADAFYKNLTQPTPGFLLMPTGYWNKPLLRCEPAILALDHFQFNKKKPAHNIPNNATVKLYAVASLSAKARLAHVARARVESMRRKKREEERKQMLESCELPSTTPAPGAPQQEGDDYWNQWPTTSRHSAVSEAGTSENEEPQSKQGVPKRRKRRSSVQSSASSAGEGGPLRTRQGPNSPIRNVGKSSM